MTDPLSVAQTVIGLALQLRELVKQAKDNRAQSTRLGERVGGLAELLQRLSPQQLRSLRQPLHGLQLCLEDCSALVKQFGQQRTVFDVLRASSQQQDFADCNARLQQLVGDVNLALQIEQSRTLQAQFSSSDDAADLRADCEQLKAGQADILAELREHEKRNSSDGGHQKSGKA